MITSFFSFCHTHRHAVVLTYPHTQPYTNPLGSGPLWRWRDDAWHRTQAQERNLRGHEKLGPRHRGKDHQTRKGASTTRTPPSGRRDELILKEELLAMLPMRPECSQMISAPYPGRLPGEGGVTIEPTAWTPGIVSATHAKRDELPGLPEADGALRLLRSTNHPVRASHRPPGGK